MGSSEQSNLREKITPFFTIARADLESTLKSRMVLGWIIAALFLSVIRILNSRIIGASSTITQGLSDFLFLWSMIIIGITGSTVSSESGVLADSLLSKSVKRHEYILAKFCSRIVLVFATYAVISTVLVGLSVRLGTDGIEIYGLVLAVLVVGLALVTLATMGVTFSTVFPSSIFSIVALLVVWYSMTFFFSLIDEIQFLSPGFLVQELPRIMQGNWNGADLKIVGGYGLMSVLFLVISLIYFSNKDL